MMRLGANDYIMKDNLKRLGPAVMRELQEARIRQELRTASQRAGSQNRPDPIEKPTAKTSRSKPVDLLHIMEAGSRSEQDTNVITERHKAVVNILYTAGLIKKHQNRILEQNDLTEQKLNVLLVLSRHHQSITINTLKDEILNKTGEYSLIERMAKLDLIHYVQSSKDKRARNLSISNKGRRVLDEIDDHADSMFLSENQLPENSAKIINEELKKILDAIDE